MTLKAGVRVFGIRPEIVLAMQIVDAVYREYHRELIVTSCTDGKHSATSLHYSGGAFDGRTSMFSKEDQGQLKGRVALALGAEYDVVLESDHLHVEFQPKRGTTSV